MDKLEKLTPKQEALIPIVREEWLSRFHSGQTIDQDAARVGIYWLYELSGLCRPTVIYVDSPLAAQAAANIIANGRLKVRDQVYDQVSNQVLGQVIDQVSNQVSNQVRGQVSDQVRNQVRGQVSDQVRDQVRDQVSNQVYGQVSDQVRDQVLGQVSNQVYDQVRDQVSNQVRGQVSLWFSFSYFVGAWDYSWVAFYDYFTRIGILNNEKFNKFRSLVLSGVYDTIQLDGLCIVCALPQNINRNERGFMHSDSSAAVEWRDGYKLYYLNGVHFEESLWKNVVSREMPFEDILRIENIDQRTQAMRYSDPLKFLEHTKAERVDSEEKQRPYGSPIHYHLFRIPAGDIFPKDEMYMYYECPSTGKEYFSCVDPECKTVGEAMAWKMSDEFVTVTPEQWRAMVPMVHET